MEVEKYDVDNFLKGMAPEFEDDDEDIYDEEDEVVDKDGWERKMEELQLKRERHIRDRAARWRAEQEEVLLQKRMMNEWKSMETERRIAASQEDAKRQTIEKKIAHKEKEIQCEDLDRKRVAAIVERDEERKLKGVLETQELKSDKEKTEREKREFLDKARQARISQLQREAKERAKTKKEEEEKEVRRKAVAEERERQREERMKARVNAWKKEDEEKKSAAEKALAVKMSIHMEKLYRKDNRQAVKELKEELDMRRERAIHQRELERNNRVALQVAELKAVGSPY